MTDEDEYVTDEDEDYEDEDGRIEEIDEDEEIETDDDAEEIITISTRRAGPVNANTSVPPTAAESKSWGLSRMPAVTQEAIQKSIDRLRSKGKKELTLLLLGKNGVGKSSTGNELLNEAVFNVAPFRQEAGRVVSVARRVGDFTFRVIDTPGLMDGDQVDCRAVAQIQAEASQTPIDVVLYIDRSDLYRVESADHEALAAVTTALGSQVWQHTILTLTRAQMSSPPEGYSYDDFVQQRVAKLQQAVKQAGGPTEIAFTLIENSSKCFKGPDGEKSPIPHKIPWRPALFDQMVNIASTAAQHFKADKTEAARQANPNKRNRLWIPILLAAQIAFKIFVFDRLVEEDGVRGDENGPFDKLTVKERRQELADQKASKTDFRQKDREASERARVAAFTGSAARGNSDSEDSEEEEEEGSDSSSDSDS